MEKLKWKNMDEETYNLIQEQLEREPRPTLKSISKEFNVSYSSLRQWIGSGKFKYDFHDATKNRHKNPYLSLPLLTRFNIRAMIQDGVHTPDIAMRNNVTAEQVSRWRREKYFERDEELQKFLLSKNG